MKLIILLIISLLTANAAVISNFSAGAEGWTAVTANPSVNGFPASSGTPTVSWDVGGFVKVADIDNLDTMFVAPSNWLGNQLSALNTTLKFDLIAFNPPNYAAALVVAKGGGLTLVYTPPSPTLIHNVWVSHNVPLTSGSQWRRHATGNPAATGSDFQTVFGNLTALWISAENVGGIVETTGLDNVRLEQNGGPVNTVPEPSSMALGVAGLALLCGCKRRNRRLDVF